MVAPFAHHFKAVGLLGLGRNPHPRNPFNLREVAVSGNQFGSRFHQMSGNPAFSRAGLKSSLIAIPFTSKQLLPPICHCLKIP